MLSRSEPKVGEVLRIALEFSRKALYQQLLMICVLLPSGSARCSTSFVAARVRCVDYRIANRFIVFIGGVDSVDK